MFKEIIETIRQKYKDGIYILQEGELEDYIDIEGKSLEKVINFCENYFDAWQSSKASHVKEIEGIFVAIGALEETANAVKAF